MLCYIIIASMKEPLNKNLEEARWSMKHSGHPPGKYVDYKNHVRLADSR
jgi:hypothetical protein